MHHLADNFINIQITIETLRTGCAESAVQRAPNLRRYAQSAPLWLRYENRFHCLTRAGLKQPLDRSIG